MEELIRFNYKGKELVLFSQDGEFVYASFINDELNYNLTEEEKKVLDKALTLTMTSHDLADLGYIKYNQKKFRHFYDSVRDFHLFYEGDDLNIPDPDDLFNLNYIFNNQEEYVAIYRKESYHEKQVKKIKRVIKIGGVSTLVLISLAGIELSLNHLLKEEPLRLVANGTLPTPNSRIVYQDVTISNQGEIGVEDIAKAVLSNSNLTSSEKNLFLKSSRFLESLAPYLNEDVLYKLRNFKIEYASNLGNNNRTAEWQDTLLTMKVYNAIDFESAEKSSLSHEFIHIFSNNPNITLGHALYEFTTANINNEYYGDSNNYDNSYNWLTRYGMPLIQIIGPDNIRKYYVNPRPNILTSALMEIIPDYNMACHVISNFDTFNNLWRDHYDADFQEKWGSTMNQVIYELDNELMQYYNAKYTNNNLENLSCLYYLDKTSASLKIADNLGASEETKNNIIAYPDAVSLKMPNRNFNIYGDSRMVLNFPTEFKVSEKIYTKEQLLTGIDGMKYENIFKIDLPMIKDGVYKKIDIYTNDMEYRVPDVYSLEKSNKK